MEWYKVKIDIVWCLHKVLFAMVVRDVWRDICFMAAKLARSMSP